MAFAVCMRSHGLPDYPDPQISSSGGEVHVKISPGNLNPNSPAFKSAGQSCHQLLPDGGAPGAAGANSAQAQAQGLRFAVCMRSHGVPDFPDPDHDGAFDLPSAINQQAPQFQRAMQACMKVQPSSLTINHVQVALDATAADGSLTRSVSTTSADPTAPRAEYRVCISAGVSPARVPHLVFATSRAVQVRPTVRRPLLD